MSEDEQERIGIAKSSQLGEGRSVAFSYRDEYGLPSDGFAFRYRGNVFAYKNQCRHQPLPLDYGDNEFFTEACDYLLCRNHGALFDPETGKCVDGPCTGASLFQVRVIEEDGEIFVLPPVLGEAMDLE
jgi:nitrite reductase/ring-hydroxylating ferredoxin subunit